VHLVVLVEIPQETLVDGVQETTRKSFTGPSRPLTAGPSRNQSSSPFMSAASVFTRAEDCAGSDQCQDGASSEQEETTAVLMGDGELSDGGTDRRTRYT
jgi:hypothetical protein